MISENAKEENGKAKKGRRKKGTGTEAERRETKTGCGNYMIMPEKFLRDHAENFCRASVIIAASFAVLLPMPLLPKISLCACVYMTEKIGKGKRIRTGSKTGNGKS